MIKTNGKAKCININTVKLKICSIRGKLLYDYIMC